MKALVIYGSRYGNTRKLADAIGTGLEAIASVQRLALDEVQPSNIASADMVVIGCPTEAHAMTRAMKGFFAGAARSALKGKPAAAFDTRLDWPAWLSGSACRGIVKQLRKAGADVVAPGESFIVRGQPPVVDPGEVARGTSWGKSLAGVISDRKVPAGWRQQ